MLLGAHVSISVSIDQSVDRARDLGCTTFQIFTRNPRGWAFKKLRSDEVSEFRRKAGEAGYSVIIAHMPYLPNIASPSRPIWNKSLKTLTAELRRCDELGIRYLVCHVGSHMGKGIDVGITQVARAVDRAIEDAEPKCMLLLENMAGQRNSVGSRFEDLKRILTRASHGGEVGICLDTCHLFAAGYDLKTEAAIESTLGDFDDVIGLKRLKVIHLNDSKGSLGSHQDRHEHIGLGEIGERGFRLFINHRSIKDLPMIIETPIDARGGSERDLAVLRRLYDAT